LITLILSGYMNVGQMTNITYACFRATIQLTVLSSILVPIFKMEYWWLVSLYLLFMVFVGAHAVRGRPRYAYKGMFAHIFLVMLLIPVPIVLGTIAFIIQTWPFWEAQYAIPLSGMALGNTLAGLSLGLDSVLNDLKQGRGYIELMLAAGATRTEACYQCMKDAALVAMTPQISSLTVIGVVSIPGMMTGQILGGSSPEQAARYQLVVMFMILSSVCLSVVSVAYLCIITIVDSDGVLDTQKIARQEKAKGDLIATLVQSAGRTLWSGLVKLSKCFTRSPRPQDVAEDEEPLLP